MLKSVGYDLKLNDLKSSFDIKLGDSLFLIWNQSEDHDLDFEF